MGATMKCHFMICEEQCKQILYVYVRHAGFVVAISRFPLNTMHAGLVTPFQDFPSKDNQVC